MDNRQESTEQDGPGSLNLEKGCYSAVSSKPAENLEIMVKKTPRSLKGRDDAFSTLSPSSTCTGSTGISPSNAGMFGKMLAAAEQQRMRPLKKLQLLRRQSEQHEHAAGAQAQKEAQQLLRAKAHEAGLEQQKLERAKQDAARELRRREVAEAAEARQEELRNAAEQKMARHEAQAAVLSAQKAAQQAKLRSRHEALEQQRQQAAQRRLAQQEEQEKKLAEKLRAVEDAQQRKQAEKAEAEERRRAEEAAREAERQAIIQRAEQQSSSRARELDVKGAAKEAARQKQLQAEAQARAARSSEAQQQEAAVRQRMLLKVQQDKEAARKVANRYEEKMARSRQIAQQREALTGQLQRVRLSIAKQERLLKESYAKLEKTGKLELSPQLLQLEKLAISLPLPDSPASDLIRAYSGFSTPRSSASLRRSRASKLTSSGRKAGSKIQQLQFHTASEKGPTGLEDLPGSSHTPLRRADHAGSQEIEDWNDEGDGTLVGTLGYGKVLESPALAYCDLQAELLAYAQERAPDGAAEQAASLA